MVMFRIDHRFSGKNHGKSLLFDDTERVQEGFPQIIAVPWQSDTETSGEASGDIAGKVPGLPDKKVLRRVSALHFGGCGQKVEDLILFPVSVSVWKG